MAEQKNAPPVPADEVAALKAELARRDATEKIVAEKTAKGLTREQALAVIANQKAYDAAKAKK